MFKKLKQKLNEEQFPVRSSLAQASPKSTPPSTGNRSHTSSLSGQHNEGTLGDREMPLKNGNPNYFLSFLSGLKLKRNTVVGTLQKLR